MNQKKNIMLMIAVILVCLPVFKQVSYASPNVEDCLSGVADCEEQSLEPEEEADGNDFLIENKDKNHSLVLDIVKMFFALLLVLALIFIAIRLLGRRNHLFNQVKVLENFGGISLGPNRSIQIVRVGQKFYLIGVGENVELLEEITDKQLIESLMNEKESTANFLQMATSFNRKQPSKTKATDFKKLFKTELDQLKQNRKTMIHQYKEDRHE